MAFTNIAHASQVVVADPASSLTWMRMISAKGADITSKGAKSVLKSWSSAGLAASGFIRPAKAAKSSDERKVVNAASSVHSGALLSLDLFER